MGQVLKIDRTTYRRYYVEEPAPETELENPLFALNASLEAELEKFRLLMAGGSISASAARYASLKAEWERKHGRRRPN